MQRFYHKLSEIFQNHLLAKKYLLMPSYRAGLMVRQAAAERDIPLLDFEVETISGLIRSRAEEFLYESGTELIPDGQIRIILLDILQEMRERGELEYFSGLELTSGVLEVTASTVLELRLAGFSAAELQKREKEFVQPAKGRDMARIMKKYENRLAENSYADRAAAIRLFLQEEEDKTSGPPGEKEIHLIPDTLELAPLEEKFLESLTESQEKGPIILPTPPVYNRATPDHYRITSSGGGTEDSLQKFQDSPFRYLFAPEKLTEPKDDDAEKPAEMRVEEFQDRVHLHRAYGKSNEIKGIFRHIKEEEIPLDCAAIYYTRQEPYTQLCFELAGRLDLPVTFAAGINIKNTGPGQLYFRLLDWIASDYSVKYIHVALQQELLEVDGQEEEIAALLRDLKIGWRRERYEKLLAEAVEAEAGGGEKREADTARAARRLIGELFSRLPESDEEGEINTGRLAEGLSRVVKDMAAISADGGVEKKSLDVEARNHIAGRLQLMADHYQQREASDRSVSRLRNLIAGSRVGSSSPQPGHLHIAPCRQAPWPDRSHNFLVGLDAESFPGPQREDPVLLDEERERLGGLRLRAESGQLKVYQLTQALSSLQGSIHLSYSCFDTSECSDTAPAPFFLQIHRLRTADPGRDYRSLEKSLTEVEEFVPARQEMLLSEKSLWLSLGQAENNITGAELAGLADDLFPALSRGRKTLARRRDDSFNPCCGEVDVDREEVDPRLSRQALSASKLERMATCPLKYFLQNVLGVEEPEELEREPLEWLDAMERGSLLHGIYEQFYREISRRDESPGLDDHEELILEIARQEAEKYRRETPPPSEMVYEQEMREILDSCRFFLASEEEYSRDRDRDPLLFEFYFGTNREEDERFQGGAARLKLPAGGELKFSGIIDRVDHLGGGDYEVIDYKTGSSYGYSASAYFKKGRQLQHALYALALEQLAREDISVGRSGYVFASRRGEGLRYMKEPAGREDVREVVEILVEAMARGVFPPARYDRDYSHCYICEFNEKTCERERKDDLNEIWQESDHEGVELLRRLDHYE